MFRRVRIIAPSSTCLDANDKLAQCVELLESNGFAVSFPSDIFSTIYHPYHANTMELRIAHFKAAMEDPNVDVIWAFRGGSSAAEIVDACMDIDVSRIGHKLLIGYSDITTLHLLFQKIFRIRTLHASVLLNLIGSQATHMRCIKSILAGEIYSIPVQPLNDLAMQSIVQGVICGGNLCVLETNIGTSLHPDFNEKIVLFEDVGEPGYKIARMFNHFERAGLLAGVKAVLLGDFLDEKDEHVQLALDEFVERHQHAPIYRIPCGHGPRNHPILLGSPVVLTCELLRFNLEE